MILAQAATPDNPEIEAARQAIVQVLSGIPKAAESQPVQYLNVIVVLAVLGVICFGTWRILAFMKEKAVEERLAREERAKAEEKDRQHTQAILDGLKDRAIDDRDTCHTHSLQMLTKATEGAARISEATSNLQTTTTDLKAAVHDVRNIATENKNLIETILFERGNPTPVVNQVINPPASIQTTTTTPPKRT